MFWSLFSGIFFSFLCSIIIISSKYIGLVWKNFIKKGKLKSINKLVKKDGYRHISEAVGSKNYQFLVDETDRSIFG